MDQPRIDPAELAITLKVLEELPQLPPEHEDIRTVKRAASYMYKMIKKARRAEIRRTRQEHDQRIIEQTATGSALRIDDETAGIPLVSTASGAFAGELITARGCYICKQDFTLVDAFYHWLCPGCASMSHKKRDQRTDLTGRRALLTGGRAKIGMYIALRLLRDGAHTTITTRFPHDAIRRFSTLPDAPDWLDRLKIVGIDLRDPTQVIALADDVAADGPLDILINNACQTVRRTPGAYSALVEMESAPLPTNIALPEMVSFDRISEAHPAAIAGALSAEPVAHHDGESPEAARLTHTAAQLTSLSLSAGAASLEAHLAGTAVDAGGLLPDMSANNSWTQKVDEVDPLELLEVQLCNQVGHSRPEEGSEHYFAYAVENEMGHGLPHGDLVGPAILLFAQLQGQDTAKLEKALKACNVPLNNIPQDTIDRTLKILPEYSRRHNLSFGIAHKLEVK